MEFIIHFCFSYFSFFGCGHFINFWHVYCIMKLIAPRHKINVLNFQSIYRAFYLPFIASRANLIKKLCRSCFTSVSKGNKLWLKLEPLSPLATGAKFGVVLWIIETILSKVRVNFSINCINVGTWGLVHSGEPSTCPGRNTIDTHYGRIFFYLVRLKRSLHVLHFTSAFVRNL